MRKMLVAAVVLTVSLPALAGGLQKELKGRWLGAWVVTTTESYSDCAGRYTDNRIHGNLVKSAGAYRFQAGELAKLDKVDLKKSRMDLMLTFQEPILVSYQDGPFQLFTERFCQVELEVALDRRSVKGKNASAVEDYLLEVVERYATEDDARASGEYNGRERDPYPDDYDLTLARHARWRAEQTNERVQLQMDRAVEEAGRLADRLDENPVYLAGFAEGVQAARSVNLDVCNNLLAVDLAEIRRQAARAKAKDPTLAAEHRQGFEDGKVFVYGLEMMRNLPGCFVPLPEVPGETGAAEVAAYR